MNKEELIDLINEIFGWTECPTMILRQINKYIRECGYTYKQIARALSYYVDVQGNKLEPKYGIAIVKYVMQESEKYYAVLAQQKLQQLNAARKAKQSQNNITVIKCKPNNEKTIKRNKINISDIR